MIFQILSFLFPSLKSKNRTGYSFVSSFFGIICCTKTYYTLSDLYAINIYIYVVTADFFFLYVITADFCFVACTSYQSWAHATTVATIEHCFQQGFQSRPVLRRLRLRECFISSRLRLLLLVKENIILEFFKTDNELSKIRSYTCTSTCRSRFMFTLEKTSNDVKFHVTLVNY